MPPATSLEYTTYLHDIFLKPSFCAVPKPDFFCPPLFKCTHRLNYFNLHNMQCREAIEIIHNSIFLFRLQ